MDMILRVSHASSARMTVFAEIVQHSKVRLSHWPWVKMNDSTLVTPLKANFTDNAFACGLGVVWFWMMTCSTLSNGIYIIFLHSPTDMYVIKSHIPIVKVN
jgi:hypothetical protein